MTHVQEPIQTCLYCEGPIPAAKAKDPRTKYCDHLCARKAHYYRKSPEERTAYNKQSNDRRMQKDLLPILRTLGRSASEAEIIDGTPLGRYAVGMFLLARMSDWKLDHALNFNQARNALSKLAGGESELEEIEEMIFSHVLATM